MEKFWSHLPHRALGRGRELEVVGKKHVLRILER